MELTGWFSALDLRTALGPGKSVLVVETLSCALRVGSSPKGNKRASTMHTSVFVANDCHILQWTKTIECGKDVFLVH